MSSAFDPNPYYKPGDKVVVTCFDDFPTGIVLNTPAVNLVRVKLDKWTKEDIKRFGGESEAWLVFSNDQVRRKRESNDPVR